MKIIKTASGKKTIKISRSEWEGIGKKAGWGCEECKELFLKEDIDDGDAPTKECSDCEKLFPENKLDKGCCKGCWAIRKGDHLRDMQKDEK